MALSNLLNEPRREIIEQVAGLGGLVAYGGAAYAVGLLLAPGEPIFGTVLGLLSIPAGAAILFLLAELMHAIGEGVCAIFASIGADPRPKDRYRR